MWKNAGNWIRKLARTWPVLFWLFNLATARADAPDFERDIAPLFVGHCLDCHQPNRRSGGLGLSTLAGLQIGGELGPSLVIGQPESSRILERVMAGEMPPPESDYEPLGAEEVAKLRTWIAAGAPWPTDRELGIHEKQVDLRQAREFWSFRAVQRPAIPSVQQVTRVANPIDVFVWRELEARGIEMADAASPGDLLRRLSLDVRGLPPTLEEQDEFLADRSPDAYRRLVDRMLHDAAYGERWARYWLDLVRYADSNGYERDAPKPGVWRYRDYVIRSLNDDKPYDRFVLEQLAGDELDNADFDAYAATGFHALGTWQDEVDPLEAAQYRADELDDMVRTTSQTLLGITLGCARCHQHKFDPFTMVDYYSLAAILAPLQRPNQGRLDRDYPAAAAVRIAQQEQRDREVGVLEEKIAARMDEQVGPWLEQGRSRLPADVQTAWRIPADRRTPAQQQMVRKYRSEVHQELSGIMSEALRQEIDSMRATQQSWRATAPELPRVYRLFENASHAPPTHLLLSGRASHPGPAMRPRVPDVLALVQPEFPAGGSHSTLRRRTFATWVVSPQNPLTARVIVNRVWQHHFGTGLVATPSDFGQIGSRPTHPELLDWLADWFVHDARWSLKSLHRLILSSETYRQSTAWQQQAALVDPENRLLWRHPYRRLDIEALRDSMLAVSGGLHHRLYGPAVYLPVPAAVVEAHTDKESAWRASVEPDIDRRTIYAFVKRTLLVPMLETFDFCDTTQSTDRRAVTSVAPQALTLMNGEFVNRLADRFARRLEQEAGRDQRQQIELAYRLVLGRRPTVDEIDILQSFLAREFAELRARANGQSIDDAGARHHCLEQMCRALLNLNEFAYPN